MVVRLCIQTHAGCRSVALLGKAAHSYDAEARLKRAKISAMGLMPSSNP